MSETSGLPAWIRAAGEETRFKRVEVTVTSAEGQVTTLAADWPAKTSVTLETGLQAAPRNGCPWPSVSGMQANARLLVEVEADGNRPILVTATQPRPQRFERMAPLADDEVVAFAAARLAEDEQWARRFAGLLADVHVRNADTPEHQRATVAFTFGQERFDPGTLLDQARAKQAVIGRQESDHAPVETMYGPCCRTCVDWQDAPLAEGGETEFGIAIPQSWPCRVARSVLASWSGHPDYREAWKP